MNVAVPVSLPVVCLPQANLLRLHHPALPRALPGPAETQPCRKAPGCPHSSGLDHGGFACFPIPRLVSGEGRSGKHAAGVGYSRGRRDAGPATLPRVSVGADGQPGCIPTPGPGCLFPHQCGQRPSEHTVTDTKQQPRDMVRQGPCHPLLRTITAPTPCMSAGPRLAPCLVIVKRHFQEAAAGSPQGT